MPETGVLTRPTAMLPKLPTAAVLVRAGWPVFQVIVPSVQVVAVRQIAGPLVVALVTWRLRLAALIDSPAASAGMSNRRYGVARVAALPSVASASDFRLTAVPAVVVGVDWLAVTSATGFRVSVRVPPVGAVLIV